MAGEARIAARSWKRAPEFGPGAWQVTLRCERGASRFILMPGRDPAKNLAALGFVRARHAAAHDCGCADAACGAEAETEPGARG